MLESVISATKKQIDTYIRSDEDLGGYIYIYIYMAYLRPKTGGSWGGSRNMAPPLTTRTPPFRVFH